MGIDQAEYDRIAAEYAQMTVYAGPEAAHEWFIEQYGGLSGSDDALEQKLYSTATYEYTSWAANRDLEIDTAALYDILGSEGTEAAVEYLETTYPEAPDLEAAIVTVTDPTVAGLTGLSKAELDQAQSVIAEDKMALGSSLLSTALETTDATRLHGTTTDIADQAITTLDEAILRDEVGSVSLPEYNELLKSSGQSPLTLEQFVAVVEIGDAEKALLARTAVQVESLATTIDLVASQNLDSSTESVATGEPVTAQEATAPEETDWREGYDWQYDDTRELSPGMTGSEGWAEYVVNEDLSITYKVKSTGETKTVKQGTSGYEHLRQTGALKWKEAEPTEEDLKYQLSGKQLSEGIGWQAPDPLGPAPKSLKEMMKDAEDAAAAAAAAAAATQKLADEKAAAAVLREKTAELSKTEEAAKLDDAAIQAAEEEITETSDFIKEYYEGEGDEKVLTSGEKLDEFTELDAVLTEVREQRADIDAFLASDIELKYDSDGDGDIDEYDTGTVSGVAGELLEKTEQLASLEEQKEALDAFEEDILARADEIAIAKGIELEEKLITAGGDPSATTAASFWTNTPKYSPKFQHRFRVKIGGLGLKDALGDKGQTVGATGQRGDNYNDEIDDGAGDVWYAKSVDKPTMSLAVLGEEWRNLGSYTPVSEPLVEQPNWSPVTMTLVDPGYPNASRKLARLLRRAGYGDIKAMAINKGRNLDAFRKTIGEVMIEQLDIDGKVLEIWYLQDAYPMEINYGKLDYASNDLLEITVKWAYKTVRINFRAHGAEEEYDYYKDYTPYVENPANHGSVCDQRYNSAKTVDPSLLQPDWQANLDSDDGCYKAPEKKE